MTTLWDWINERHKIYLRKCWVNAIQPPRWADPDCYLFAGALWTNDHLSHDPIFQTFRFCNVFRELDRVTEWIRVNIREPYADHEYLWYMLMIGRELNWPPSLEALMRQGAWPDRKDFRPNHITGVLRALSHRKEKWHTGAYMVQAPNRRWFSHISKMEYVGERVLGSPWRDRDSWCSWFARPQTLQATHHRVMTWDGYCGWGPFMSYEWVTDLRHTRYLRDATDVNTWANAGPGAIRGLNRIHERPLKYKPKPEVTLTEMSDLLLDSPNHLKSHVPRLELRDIEHSLCEYDKYERVRLGQGRPRAKYVPGRGW